MASPNFEYDVCVSFAGEQREYVAEVANYLKNHGMRVFYDDYEKASLWGKDLYEHLDSVYGKAARYCILFVSAEYAAKVWTSHERRSAQARAFSESQEYLLPVRFDDTEIPGLKGTIGYLDATKLRPDEIADLALQKVGPKVISNFLPNDPVRLYEVLEVHDNATKADVLQISRDFFKILKLMSVDERRFLALIFCEGCPLELPKNVHISLGLIERLTGNSVQEALLLMQRLSALGFSTERRRVESHEESLVVVWRDVAERQFFKEYARDNSTAVACYMLRLGCGVDCSECTEKCVERLDFSNLAHQSPSGLGS